MSDPVVSPVVPAPVPLKPTLGSWLKQAVADVWKWILAWTQFLDDKNGKFSHKRLIALAFAVVAIRQVIIADYVGAIILASAAVVLAVVSAITGT